MWNMCWTPTERKKHVRIDPFGTQGTSQPTTQGDGIEVYEEYVRITKFDPIIVIVGLAYARCYY